jgi:predicted nuclease with TOPRIM domain
MDFATLTEDEFKGFVKDAQQLKDTAKTLETQLTEANAKLESVQVERDRLALEKVEAEKQAKLSQQVSGMRSQADQLLSDLKISADEFAQYFGKELSEDLTKFGSDEIEMKVIERFLQMAAKRSAAVSPRINVNSLATDGKANGYVTTLTAENLAQ